GGVWVVVEGLGPDVEQAGRTKQQLQTDVELWLRKAEIPVLTEKEVLEVPGAPWLYVNVHVLLHSHGLAAFHIDVELNQRASLATTTSPAVVATWSRGKIGTVAISKLNTICDNVRDLIEGLIK